MKIFIGLLTGLVIGPNHATWVSLRNRKRMAQSAFVNLHPNEYSQEVHYYSFVVNVDICWKL